MGGGGVVDGGKHVRFMPQYPTLPFCRGTARNFNPDAAGAGKICIAEVEEIVEAGTFRAEDIHLPGIFVDRIIVNPNPEKRIEVLAAHALTSIVLSLS